jgi:hypothetical protein
LLQIGRRINPIDVFILHISHAHMRTLTQFSAQRYCFFLICANIFEKICNYLHM